MKRRHRNSENQPHKKQTIAEYRCSAIQKGSLMGTTHIGCSGFHYKHWKGSFYPEILPQTKWFKHYCEHFDTLELNVTFYRFPRLHTLQKWYADSLFFNNDINTHAVSNAMELKRMVSII